MGFGELCADELGTAALGVSACESFQVSPAVPRAKANRATLMYVVLEVVIGELSFCVSFEVRSLSGGGALWGRVL